MSGDSNEQKKHESENLMYVRERSGTKLEGEGNGSSEINWSLRME